MSNVGNERDDDEPGEWPPVDSDLDGSRLLVALAVVLTVVSVIVGLIATFSTPGR